LAALGGKKVSAKEPMELLLLMVLSSFLWQSNLDISLHTPPYMHYEQTCKLVSRLDSHRRLNNTIFKGAGVANQRCVRKARYLP
jgi:hypothetical protein